MPGVGEVFVFGAGDYAMRIWLDPHKLAARNLTAADVVAAIREQNQQVAAGVVGAPPGGREHRVAAVGQRPGPPDRARRSSATSSSRPAPTARSCACATSPASNSAPASIRCAPLLNNKPAVAIAIFQAPGSNAIAHCRQGRAKLMAELKREHAGRRGLPDRLRPDAVRARSPSRRWSTRCSKRSLLVVLVVILFLQTWRASIIPLLAVPVSIIGTFAVMQLFGFSINALTLFGLVLAIGIVVDDAIVVVENVERNIELGLDAKAATHRAMDEVTGPIIAIALVLCAVFVPIAFISGPDRAVLQAVRADHRHLDGDLGVQLADPVAGAGRRPAEGARRAQGPADARPRLLLRLVLPRLQPALPAARRRGYVRGVRGVVSRKASWCWLVYLGLVGADHGRLSAACRAASCRLAGQAVPGRLRPTARWRHPGPHRGCDPPHGRDRQAEPQRGRRHRLPGPVDQRLHQRAQRRPGVLQPRAVRRAQAPRSQRRRHRAEAQPAVGGDPGRLHRDVPAAAGGGLGTIGGFKLQIEDRAGLGYEALDQATKAVLDEGLADAGAGRRVLQLPDQRAAALCRHRPRQGQAHGRRFE